MRIACLQFAPHVGDIDNNLNRADSVLNRANTEGLDLLVLPELAFTGEFELYTRLLAQAALRAPILLASFNQRVANMLAPY